MEKQYEKEGHMERNPLGYMDISTQGAPRHSSNTIPANYPRYDSHDCIHDPRHVWTSWVYTTHPRYYPIRYHA